MRRWLFILVFAGAVLARADTIRLKSGHIIIADRVREKDGRVYYEVGDNSYAIPKSLVESIETSTPAPPPKPAPPAVRPAQQPKAADVSAMPQKDGVPAVVRDGEVDSEVLAGLEGGEDAEAAAAGFFAAGRHEQGRGNRERARAYFERALKFAPENPELLTQYATVLVQLGQAAGAVPFAERATKLAANSADAFAVLGFAYYSDGRIQDAVRAWGRALELRPDESVRGYLDKAQRELNAEAQFSQSERGHFSVRYEGASTSDGLRDQVHQALEAGYKELVQQLGIAPQGSISVALYTDQAFFDVTHAPAWIGALNDGKLRIPIQGITAVTPELQRVLKHELAHSFINQAAHGRCPQWLHEGLAQLLEPKTLGETRGGRLAAMYRQGAQIPLNTLEAPFLMLSPFEAVLGYDEALGAAEYIRDTYGMGRLASILTRIGDGSSTETALRATIHAGYSDLEQRLGRYLAAKYGK